MFIYESHLGGLFVSDEEIQVEDLYCDQCGDYDNYVYQADTREEAWDALKDDVNINGSGGWDLDYINEFLDENFTQ